jgi:hypothetical protein
MDASKTNGVGVGQIEGLPQPRTYSWLSSLHMHLTAQDCTLEALGKGGGLNASATAPLELQTRQALWRQLIHVIIFARSLAP